MISKVCFISLTFQRPATKSNYKSLSNLSKTIEWLCQISLVNIISKLSNLLFFNYSYFFFLFHHSFPHYFISISREGILHSWLVQPEWQGTGWYCSRSTKRFFSIGFNVLVRVLKLQQVIKETPFSSITAESNCLPSISFRTIESSTAVSDYDK